LYVIPNPQIGSVKPVTWLYVTPTIGPKDIWFRGGFISNGLPLPPINFKPSNDLSVINGV